MNKVRRANLSKALSHLETAACLVSDAKDEEQECMDNLPENMQDGERYGAMDAAVDHLDDAQDSIRDAIRHITAAQE